MENYAIDNTTSLPSVPSTLAGDMRFISWFTIIQGALSCLSIFGAIIGIPVLISGLRLKEAAEEMEAYQRNGSAASLSKALERQSRHFAIQKIILLIALVFAALGIVAMILVFAGIIGSGGFREMMDRT